MNARESRTYETLARVREFCANHASAFPADSYQGGLVARVDEALERLSSRSQRQAAGRGTLREGTRHRARLRDAVRQHVDTIARTARSISYDVPGTDAKFRAPGPCRDRHLLETAKRFAVDAAPLRQEFAKFSLTAAFFEKLAADVADLEAALALQRAGREARITATAEVRLAMADGLLAVRLLETVVLNTFRDDLASLGAWRAASRVPTRSARTAKPQAGQASDVPTSPQA